jgi:hypothetical protein
MRSPSVTRSSCSRLGLWACAAGLCSILAAAGCASNPYGYGRVYAPSDEEEPYYERALEVSYEEVRRDPQAFSGRTVGWFGVVTAAKRLPSGEVQLALDLRFHQPRHLCSDQFESSCRVTISDRAGGPFSTRVRLRPDDESGSTRLNIGSLVRVYGTATGEFDDRGGPLLKTEFYRHWPHGAYVTTSGSNAMRR